MRKTFFRFAFFAFAGVLLSCSVESETDSPDSEQELALESYVVPLDEAKANVESLLADLDAETRGGSPRTISETIVSGGFGATRSADGEEEPLYYIFNFADEQGYALTSGDTRTPPIFCVTDSGSFDVETIAENPGALMTLISYDTDYRVTVGLPVLNPDGNGWINPGEPGYPGGVGWNNGVVESYDDYITIDGKPRDTRPRTAVAGPWAISNRYGTVIAAQWGQRTPYNDNFPWWGYDANGNLEHAVTGCGTTAVAQILYHYGYPSSIDDGRGTIHNLDWNLMRQHIKYISDDESTDAHLNHKPAHKNIATLFQELSKTRYLNASYADSDETNATGVDVDKIAKAFRRLGYNPNDKADYNADAVMAAMKRNMPVIISGYAYRTSVYFLGIRVDYKYSEGHYWVCDQLMVRKREIEWYRGDELIDTEVQTQNLLHCNWGWNGSWNGYFLPTEFNIDNRILPDTTRGTENFYQYDMKMWDWIRR